MFETVLASIIGLWLGSVEYRMRHSREKLDNTPTRDEVKETIDNKTEALKALQAEELQDIKRIEQKVDMLIRMHLQDKD